MGAQYAQTEIRTCPMYEAVCEAKVLEHIASFYGPGTDVSAILDERVGRYTRGQHKGKRKGWAHVKIVTRGGWKWYGAGEGQGRVLYPGTVAGVEIKDYTGKVLFAVSN